MVDDYTPSNIIRHQIFRGRGLPELQFLTSWFPGWTMNPKEYARRVIRQHRTEQDLFFVEFKDNWEPFNNPLIYQLIEQYRTSKGIKAFGNPFDHWLASTNMQNLNDNDQEHPHIYSFMYQDQEDIKVESDIDDDSKNNSHLRKKRGRPRKEREPKKKRVLKERSGR